MNNYSTICSASKLRNLSNTLVNPYASQRNIDDANYELSNCYRTMSDTPPPQLSPSFYTTNSPQLSNNYSTSNTIPSPQPLAARLPPSPYITLSPSPTPFPDRIIRVPRVPASASPSPPPVRKPSPVAVVVTKPSPPMLSVDPKDLKSNGTATVKINNPRTDSTVIPTLFSFDNKDITRSKKITVTLDKITITGLTKNQDYFVTAYFKTNNNLTSISSNKVKIKLPVYGGFIKKKKLSKNKKLSKTKKLNKTKKLRN